MNQSALAVRRHVGIPAAPGLAAGPVVLWKQADLDIPQYKASDPVLEMERLKSSLESSAQELAAVKARMVEHGSQVEAAIFDAHLLFLNDPALLDRTRRLIQAGINAEAAWLEAVAFYAGQLEQLPNPTLRERSTDVRDVGWRVVAHLLGKPGMNLPHFTRPGILITRDLTPSQTAALDTRLVRGICTAEGGPTSHTAILAKALGIPAIVGLGSAVLDELEGALALVDGYRGELLCNPDEETRLNFEFRSIQVQTEQEQAFEMAQQPACTVDGQRVEVAANISGYSDAMKAVEYGAEGVGLFRTEFLFSDRERMPEEDEQVQLYRCVFDELDDRPVIVRALDIGGDKPVRYLDFAEEANPFLGWRGIRLQEGRPDVFKRQFRALLRAGEKANLHIMVPMVSSVAEVLRSREILETARRELQEEGTPHVNEVKFGIMIEVPSAALIAGHLAPLVDFFSIGTNDLTQYTLAVDRTNPRVASLASPFHPAVLQLIQQTIQAAHKHGKWVGICGEFASDPKALPILLGLKLDEFSIAPQLIPNLKSAIRRMNAARCEEIAQHCLQLPGAEAVLEYLASQ